MFGFSFVVLALACVAIKIWNGDGLGQNLSKNPEFRSFQMNYLIVFLIMMGADWLQGPYVYALYEYYGFERNDIGLLFIGGFFSSMVFGTFVGSLADKYGRKLLCLIFGFCYSMSCVTKLYNNFNILLIGRILSGIATSLLFSSFESWMICEHNLRNFPSSGLSETFALATFGNGLVAIFAGLLASVVADNYGYVAPFMTSLVFLIMGSLVVFATWTENYGNSSVQISETITNALSTMKNDKKITLLGLIQSLFEAAMYTFVFMWTPALQAGLGESAEQLPFGLIFACFMVCIMIGSSLFSRMVARGMSLETIGSMLLLVSTVALITPVFTSNLLICYTAFLVFEVCCGIYFPCMGTLRSKFIPEQTRSAIMNFFRVPLNLFVVVVLSQIGSLSNSTVFAMCAVWLLTSYFLLKQFQKIIIQSQIDAVSAQLP